MIMAEGTVTAVSSRKEIDDKDRLSVSIQIEDIDIRRDADEEFQEVFETGK